MVIGICRALFFWTAEGGANETVGVVAEVGFVIGATDAAVEYEECEDDPAR